MIIRQMTIEDYDGVVSFWNSIEGVGMRSLDDSREGINKYLARNPGCSFVAVGDSAADCGTVLGTILSGHDGRRGYIYHAAVAPGVRMGGIGRKLADAAVEALKFEGINKAALVVFRTNIAGNGFWEHLTFHERPDLIYRDKSLNIENI